MTTALRLVDRFLPHPDAPEARTFDWIPHASLSSLVLVSSLPELLERLLRNDSFEDMGANQGRSDLYFAALSLMQTMSGCESTLDCIASPRRAKKSSPGLTAWLYDAALVKWEMQATNEEGKGKKRAASSSNQVEMTDPLMHLFDNLVRQAALLQKALQNQKGDDFDACVHPRCVQRQL